MLAPLAQGGAMHYEWRHNAETHRWELFLMMDEPHSRCVVVTYVTCELLASNRVLERLVESKTGVPLPVAATEGCAEFPRKGANLWWPIWVLICSTIGLLLWIGIIWVIMEVRLP